MKKSVFNYRSVESNHKAEQFLALALSLQVKNVTRRLSDFKKHLLIYRSERFKGRGQTIETYCKAFC